MSQVLRKGRAPRGLIAALAVAGLLAACGGGDPDTKVASEGGDTSTTAAGNEPGSAGDEISTASPEDTPGGDASGTTGAGGATPATGSAGATAKSDAAGPPAAGAYRYHTTGTTQMGANPAQPVDVNTTTTVEHLGGGKVRQTADDQRAVLEWTGSQVLLHSLDFTRPGFERHFEAKPPLQYAPIPLQVGQQWTWKLTATSYPTTIDQTSKVDRVETITVGGKKVDTIVIVTKLTLSGDVSGTIDLTQWVSSASGTPQRIHAKTNIVTFAFTSDTTSELTGFTPT